MKTKILVVEDNERHFADAQKEMQRRIKNGAQIGEGRELQVKDKETAERYNSFMKRMTIPIGRDFIRLAEVK